MKDTASKYAHALLVPTLLIAGLYLMTPDRAQQSEYFRATHECPLLFDVTILVRMLLGPLSLMMPLEGSGYVSRETGALLAIGCMVAVGIRPKPGRWWIAGIGVLVWLGSGILSEVAGT